MMLVRLGYELADTTYASKGSLSIFWELCGVNNRLITKRCIVM